MTKFYYEFLKPLILNKYFYRDYDLIFCSDIRTDEAKEKKASLKIACALENANNQVPLKFFDDFSVNEYSTDCDLSISNTHSDKQILSDQVKISAVHEFPAINYKLINSTQSSLSFNTLSEVIIQKFGLIITRKDLLTLVDLNWLNDQVVNFYMELLIERSLESNYPNLYAMSSLFYPKLQCSGFASVKNWTKKIDLFSQSLVFFPIHLGIHWCLALVDFTTKEIKYYDSMGADNKHCLQTLLLYISNEYLHKKGQVFDSSNWSFLTVKNIPQQTNTSDCGVFLCAYAECLSAGKDFNFSQENMAFIRKKIMCEISAMSFIYFTQDLWSKQKPKQFVFLM